jgi:hypothetical protein
MIFMKKILILALALTLTSSVANAQDVNVVSNENSAPRSFLSYFNPVNIIKSVFGSTKNGADIFSSLNPFNVAKKILKVQIDVAGKVLDIQDDVITKQIGLLKSTLQTAIDLKNKEIKTLVDLKTKEFDLAVSLKNKEISTLVSLKNKEIVTLKNLKTKEINIAVGLKNKEIKTFANLKTKEISAVDAGASKLIVASLNGEKYDKAKFQQIISSTKALIALKRKEISEFTALKTKEIEVLKDAKNKELQTLIDLKKKELADARSAKMKEIEVLKTRKATEIQVIGDAGLKAIDLLTVSSSASTTAILMKAGLLAASSTLIAPLNLLGVALETSPAATTTPDKFVRDVITVTVQGVQQKALVDTNQALDQAFAESLKAPGIVVEAKIESVNLPDLTI